LALKDFLRLLQWPRASVVAVPQTAPRFARRAPA